MRKTTRKLTASLLALTLLIPAPLISAASASDSKTIPQSTQQQAADYLGHWAQKDFQSWVDKGLISGYGQGIYKPNQEITRAEWVTLINRVFNLQEKAEISFMDVSETGAYYSDIQKAAAAGYISGYSDGTFRATQQVSRQEAAVMLYRLFQLNSSANTSAPKDVEDLPTWSQEAVLSLFSEGYLSGYNDGTFKGTKAVSRAEALRMIEELAGEITTKSGSYTGITSRNMVISSPGVELNNSTISGNLYLTEGIAEGDITLNNVTVKGKVYVSGGGENSIVLSNSNAADMAVDKHNGKLRIVTKGNSAVPSVRVHSGVTLEEDNSLTGAGFGQVIIENTLPNDSTIRLKGNFDSTEIKALGAPILHLAAGSITEVTLKQIVKLRVDAGTAINNLILGINDIITIQGTGKVGFDSKYSHLIKFETPSPTATATPGTSSGGSDGGVVSTPAPSATPVPPATPTPTATPEPTAPAPALTNVSVHDPSVVVDKGTYYVFGSHIDAAKSDDLMNWTHFTNGYTTPGNVLFGDLSANLAESFKWAGENDSDSKGGFSIWAPDVFWNEAYKNADGTTGAYMMYYSASSTYIRSAIGYATSQNIEGPYTYGNTVIYSGFTKEEDYDTNSKVNKKWTNTNIQKLIDNGTLDDVNPDWFDAGGSYKNKTYTNAIDPTLFYDKDGKLWMTYGSWSGGIFILEIDPATGEPKYPGEDGKTADGRLIDRYFGTHISGGMTKSGEGPYIAYDKNTGYYYLYVTYGGLASDGGYNMRQFRSTNPDGPYVDAAGQSAVLATSNDHSAIGNKVLGNFMFTNLNSDPDFQTYGYVASGHNSVNYDDETGKIFNFFHTRFPQRGETHELRVHQMFTNEDGWPITSPHRYTGETIAAVKQEDVIGAYQFVNHGKDTSAKIKSTTDIELRGDGTITGSVTGTWELKGEYYVDLLLNETENGAAVQNLYKGVFVKQWDSSRQSNVMTFTAMSNKGVTVWGSQIELLSTEQIVSNIKESLSLGNTSKIYKDLTLPTEAVRGTVITWSSSNNDIVGNDGSVTRPEKGLGNATVELTATITLGESTATKTFTIVVMELTGNVLEDGLVAAYDFEGNLSENGDRTAKGTITGNRINNTGGNITYETGEEGLAAKFDGNSGIRLPNGLIKGNTYTIGMWLNPEQLTQFTTAFFGATTDTNWISLLPYGNGGATTRMWFGNQTFHDAEAGMQIPVNQWSHIAFTYDAGAVKLYVNGVLKYTGKGFTDVFASEDAVFSLGVNYWDIPYKGLIDNLRIYESALSAEAVDLLVNGQPDCDIKVSTITITESEKALELENSFTPQVKVLPTNAGNKTLTWSSSDSNVVSVDAATGTVTALTVGGEAVITATATDGSGISADYKVKVTDGKVAYYAFDGNLNDSLQLIGTGQVTGIKIEAPTVGNITYGNGIADQAAVFDGASGIRLPDGLISSDTYTVSMWLNPEQLTTATTTFFGAASINSWISFVPQNSDGITLLWSGQAWYDALTNMRIPEQQWTHVAFTVKHGTVKVYINGVEKFSGEDFPNVFRNKNGVFSLGVNYWDVPYMGMMDELKIYSRALKSEEILTEYNSNVN
ncbi:LamG-like jellyroll fold domain-containing protein [Paenibacillus sp. FSL R10-2734]|uniref:LamG-like jellyroll fold domain-containing protein n=1 Tax=Paenibacillus sp. FSL R10-2734 TaxID=2954691 RepID=UPI0030D7D924